MKKTLLLAFAALCFVQSALAWGQSGHDAGAYIAATHLTKRAKAVIERYLGHSIVYDAAWMDDYRAEPGYEMTTWWHVDYGKGEPTKDAAGNPLEPNVLRELNRAIERLRDYRNLDDSTVVVNLRYVIHLVGDMHCPAHIKYATHDMKYDVLFEDKYRKAHKFYVHSVWDNEIITVSRIWSVSEWADELDRLPKSDKQAIAAGTPRDWLHDAAVCCEVQFEWAKPDARLGQDFLNKALPLVESQIRKAGYRLARLLNGLFD